MDWDHTVILIPSLHPDDKLHTYVKDLLAHGFSRIVVVDDGSGPSYSHFFEELKQYPACEVLGYEVNQGKGYALKHGMRHVMNHYKDAAGVITADSDGQHTAHDCIKIGEAMIKHPDKLVLGSRDFSLGSIPPKSRFGNRTTSFFFKILYGSWLPDTQTGLRGISRELMPRIADIPGNRFEYEMNMLIHAAGWHIDFEIVPIDTIYLDDNVGTHFRPLHDSWRIYKLLFANFFKFASASALSTLLDHALFNMLDRWLVPSFFRYVNPFFAQVTLVSTVIARVCSSLFNYRVNKDFVFKVNKSRKSLLRYVVLVVLVMLASAFFVESLNVSLGMDKGIAKVIVDTVLFFINYRITKTWVFPSPDERSNKK
ncbi:MAG: glycosyltransferase [Clostridiales bacterium]|nr:glycosyltransferase [Clostridiales bacterium]